jgi:hypothetical protein
LLLDKSPFVLHVLLPLLIIFKYLFFLGLLNDELGNLLILLESLIKPFLPLSGALFKPFHELMRQFRCQLGLRDLQGNYTTLSNYGVVEGIHWLEE